MSLGKINTINKFRQFKNKSEVISKNFNSIRQGTNMKSSMVSAKNSRVASRNKSKKNKKTVKKAKAKAQKKQKMVAKGSSPAKKSRLDISEHFACKQILQKPFDRFGEGKKVIQYLFEDSKEVTDHEMFQFLILTNQFYSENLLKYDMGIGVIDRSAEESNEK